MKKKIIMLSLVILIIFILLIDFFNIKNKKATYSYDDMIFTYVSSKNMNSNYKNTMNILNNSKKTIINNIKISFYKKDKLIEEINFNSIDISSKNTEINFDSKNDLSKCTKIIVEPNNVINISNTYNDGTILVNDFLETGSEYVFNLKNLTNNKLEGYKISVDYMDSDNNILYTKKYEFILNPNEIISISTLKGNISPKEVKYIKINKE